MVDRRGDVVEEALETLEIGGVERRGARRPDVARGGLEALGVAPREDDLGALGAGAPGRLEADPGAPPDDDDALAGQLRLAGHVEPTPAGSRADAISASSALSAFR